MEAIRQACAVAAVLALLLATLWWVKRRGFAGLALGLPLMGGRQTVRRLECLERLPLGPQHTLHLVRAGDVALLIAAFPNGCATLQTMSLQMAPGPDVALQEESAR